MNTFTIGIISDTHRVLPESALAIMRGEYDNAQIKEMLNINYEPSTNISKKPVNLIIHAGDIGGWAPLSHNILNELERIAPVVAVLGNCDVEGYSTGDSYVSYQMAVTEPYGIPIAVMHRPEDLSAAIRSARIKPLVRIHGHTHIPKLERLSDKSVLICPGSPTHPRGAYPERTVALLHLSTSGHVLRAEIVKL